MKEIKQTDHECILQFEENKEYLNPLIGGDSYINTDSREVQQLNGKWNFVQDLHNTGIRMKFYKEEIKNTSGMTVPIDFSFDDWEEMELPQNWNLHDDKYLYYEGIIIFRKKINVKKVEGKRYFLQFQASNHETRLWFNKEYKGRHIGGYNPFSFEVTDNIVDGENIVYVSVDGTRKKESIPAVNFDWYNYCGIYRDIELIELNETYLKNFKLSLVPDSNYNKLSLRTLIEKPIQGKEVILKIEELGIEEKIIVNKDIEEVEIKVEDLELWSPENPKLYKVDLTYNGETLTDKIGFRQVEVQGKKVFLNGEEVYVKGISVHEEYHIKGRALTREDRIQVINHAKELNCNFIRLAHYPHNGEMSKLADEMGIMLWEEIPVYWALDFTNPLTVHSAHSQLEALIYRDWNRASVAIWSIGNENPDTDERLEFMKGLADKVRLLDDTRLISAACLVVEEKIADRLVDYIDIVGINEYFGWYVPEFNTLKKILQNSKGIDKPVLISETGAGCLPGKKGEMGEFFTEEHQEYVYQKQIEILHDYDYVIGISPWILYDFRSERRQNKYQKGFNLKGLICKDREYKKPAFYTLQNFYKSK